MNTMEVIVTAVTKCAVSSFLMAHQHILTYLVPYYAVVDLGKRMRLLSYNKIWITNTTVVTKQNNVDQESAMHVSCFYLLPFNISRLESPYSFYHLTKGRRLSRPI